MGRGGGGVSGNAGGEAWYVMRNIGLYRAQGCHGSGNDQRKIFFTGREKSGNFILSQKIDILKKRRD